MADQEKNADAIQQEGVMEVDPARRTLLKAIGLAGLGGGSLMLTAGAAAASAEPSGLRKVRNIENIWIPMPDGTKLAARLWLPEDAEKHPVPAILEYNPYRKRDTQRLRDETIYPYYAARGYACLRVDIRGSGDSEGLMGDEYVQQELDDGVEIIAWLARQPWCTGNVGMTGSSWSGFNSLQVAALRPPALKAIITHNSTDDRYADDAHYMGGTLIDCMFYWGSRFFSVVAEPPDAQIVGDRWRDMWMARLNHTELHLATWLRHPHRDAYWKHGSVNENYSDIVCPVYAIGGWSDPYPNAIPRLLAGLKVPRKGLIGPWGHQFPHSGVPGPAIDYLSEALRWWDHWLKGIDTGIMKEPIYRVWMQNQMPWYGERQSDGRWVAEDSWPSPRTQPKTYYLTAAGLSLQAAPESKKILPPRQTVGFTGGPWHQPYLATDQQRDQRADDAYSLTFDSEPLTEKLEIFGGTAVELDLAVDKPVAFIAVRLNEVAPDGSSRRVTWGLLNLTHRESHEFPTALDPGKRYRVRVQLRNMAYVFKPGYRMRVAISTSYWPVMWPTPEPVTLTLFSGRSTLELPTRPPRTEDAKLREFGPAFVPETSGSTWVGERRDRTRTYEWDVASGRMVVRADLRPGGRNRLNATGTEIAMGSLEEFQVQESDPTSAKYEREFVSVFSRDSDSWHARVVTKFRFSGTKDNFLLVGDITAFEHDREVFAKTWEYTIPRRLL